MPPKNSNRQKEINECDETTTVFKKFTTHTLRDKGKRKKTKVVNKERWENVKATTRPSYHCPDGYHLRQGNHRICHGGC